MTLKELKTRLKNWYMRVTHAKMQVVMEFPDHVSVGIIFKKVEYLQKFIAMLSGETTKISSVPIEDGYVLLDKNTHQLYIEKHSNKQGIGTVFSLNIKGKNSELKKYAEVVYNHFVETGRIKE